MFNNLIEILSVFKSKYIYRLIFINIFFIINAFMQLLYVVSIYPLITLILNQQDVSLNKINYLNYIINFFPLDPFKVYLLAFAVISLLANLSMIYSNYISFNFTYNLLTNLRIFFFYNYSKKNYLEIISKNLSFYSINIFQQLDRVVMNVIGSLNNLCLQIFLILGLMTPLIIINFEIFLLIFSFFSLIFGTVLLLFKNFYKKSGEVISRNMEIRSEVLNKLVKNFQEIKIFNIFNYFITKFKLTENSINRIYKFTSFISNSTKPILEIILVLLFLLFYFLIEKLYNLQLSHFPLFAVFIFGCYKLAPSFNSIYTSINDISFNKDALNKINDEIKNFNYKNSENNKLKEDIENINSIKFKNISFRYPSSSIEAIKDISIDLNKNNIYLIKGVSGSGKTTLLNILMGLLKPNAGKILINEIIIDIFENPNWFKKVAYVPQKINVLSENIKINISLEFDENKIDIDKIIKALKAVNLYDQFKNRLNEQLNEDGKSISGGQIQRLGLVRALYKESEVIIFDEPTANLDKDNEEQIMDLIYKLKNNRIIILVSHKDIDLKNVDKTFYLLNGNLTQKHFN
jgi:ABC-type transport system involved in cytochrome bd biosynthesis fused ATPase/permease subunit